MIPDEVVERVREAADIVQIIGEHVPLKRAGTDYRGPCPFHQGTHRNFSVSPARNMYYCFVCHEGGDVFSFLMKRTGASWPEAVRQVAERSGVQIPESSPRREGTDPREPLWEMNATAAEYFTRMLWEDRVGQEARAYLAQRDISRIVADRFSLGFAPREIGLLRDYMGTLGFDEARLLQAGLLVKRDEGSLPRPRFSGRLIFPIFDSSARCVGFGGRLIGAGEPKYLNSSDSTVFSKGKLLYGLNWAKTAIRKEGKAVLVEGYFDVIRLMATGVENVVAPLGTALTPEQGTLLARYAREVVLLYDSDAAGLKATFRAGDVLLSLGVATMVGTLPPGEDPDSFAVSHGAEGVQRLIGNAVDVFERRVGVLEQKGWFRDIAQRRRALDRLVPTIRVTRDPMLRDLYMNRTSQAAGVRLDTILREVGGETVPAAAEAEQAPEGEVPPRRAGGEKRGTGSEKPVPSEAAEKALLAALLLRPAEVTRLAERLTPKDFWKESHRIIYEAIVAAGDDATAADVAAHLPAGMVPALQEIMDYSVSLEDHNRTVQDSISVLRRRALRRKIHRIQRQIALASGDEGRELLGELSTLQKRLLDTEAPVPGAGQTNEETRGT